MTDDTHGQPIKGDPLPDRSEYARHLIDIAADMVVSVDENRRIKLFNKKAEEVYGYTADEILGQPIVQLYNDADEYKRVGAMLHDQGRFTGEITGRKKNGDLFPVFVTAVLLHDADGNIVGSVGYSRDLTSEKKAAAVEREYIAMLGEEKLRKEVEHIIRHDMKSPMNSVIGFSDLLLEDGDLSDEHKQIVKIIYNAGIKTLRMLNLSMDLLKIERGVYVLNPQDFPLLPILSDVQSDNNTLLRTKRLSVHFSINQHPYSGQAAPGAGPLLVVRGEEIICYNILANLFKNAVEAAPPNSQITLAVIDSPAEPDFIQVAIHNPGAVPVEIRHRFFEKYATAGKTTGTGLGTYSAQRLTETLGGRIRMETDDATGTTVTVLLPKSRTGTGQPPSHRPTNNL